MPATTFGIYLHIHIQVEKRTESSQATLDSYPHYFHHCRHQLDIIAAFCVAVGTVLSNAKKLHTSWMNLNTRLVDDVGGDLFTTLCSSSFLVSLYNWQPKHSDAIKHTELESERDR